MSYSGPEVVRWVGLGLPVRVCNGSVPGFVVFLGVAVCSEASVSSVRHTLVVTVVEMDNIVLIVVLTDPIPVLVYVPRGIANTVLACVRVLVQGCSCGVNVRRVGLEVVEVDDRVSTAKYLPDLKVDVEAATRNGHQTSVLHGDVYPSITFADNALERRRIGYRGFDLDPGNSEVVVIQY